MNHNRATIFRIIGAVGIMALILDGKTALSGARQAVELCLYTLIPTLLPFFFLSGLLTAGLMGRKISLLRPLGRLCKIPEGAEYILLTGFLGGYPLGAQCISQGCQDGSLSPQDGRRMLAFCNNCGPAFIFGICSVLFSSPLIPWMVFFIHILSAILVAMILPGNPHPCIVRPHSTTSPMQALHHALRSMAMVCGWVILFRVVLAFGERWCFWLLPREVQVLISGFLELSNGCMQLVHLDNQQLRLIFSVCFLSFGGLCVTMQTYSAAANIDRTLYFPGKIMQLLLSLSLACLLVNPIWAVLPGVLAILVGIFLRKWEIRCRNTQKLVV